jgi:hypothetical protein
MKPRIHFPLAALALGLLLLASSCKQGPTPEELLVGSWKLKSLNIKDQAPPPPSIMAQASFNFYADGRYEILLGELDKGKWRLNEAKNVLITRTEGASADKEIDIEILTENELRLVNGAGAGAVTMVLEQDN